MELPVNPGSELEFQLLPGSIASSEVVARAPQVPEGYSPFQDFSWAKAVTCLSGIASLIMLSW